MRKKFVKNYFFDPKNWVADYLRVLQLIKSHKSDLKDSLANIDSISQQDCFSAEEKILLSSFKDHILKLVGAKSTTDFKYDYWRDSPIYKSGIKKFSSQQRNLRRKIINSLVVERAGRSNFDDLEKKKNMIIDRSFSKVREIWEILAGQDYFLAEPSELSSISSSENIDKLFKFLFSKKIKTPFFFALIVKIFLLQWAMEYYLCSSASQDNGVLSNFTQLLFKDERVICNPIYETWVVDFASKEFLVMENNDDNLVSLKRQGSFVAKVPLSQWNGWNFFFRSRRKSRVSFLMKRLKDYLEEYFDGDVDMTHIHRIPPPEFELTDSYAVMFILPPGDDVGLFRDELFSYFLENGVKFSFLPTKQTFKKKLSESGFNEDWTEKFLIANLFGHFCEMQILTMEAFMVYMYHPELAHAPYKLNEYELLREWLFF